MTTGEVARALGVGLNTVKRWIAQGELAGARTPGGHWRVPVADFRAFAARRGLAAGGAPRVLIADDDPAHCALLAAALEETGLPCEVRSVHDGYAALLQIGAWQPRLLVLDLLMPGLDGVEVLQRLRQEPVVRRDLSIVVVTSAWDRPELMRRVREAGPDCILPKPVELPRFHAAVAGGLGLQPAGPDTGG